MSEYDFGSGCTNPETMPVAELTAAAVRAIPEVGTAFARYPGDLGHQGLREVMAQRESDREGVDVSPENIALTNGSMQGVTLVAEALMEGDGKDIVVTEELTYSGTIGAYRRLGVEMVGVPVDDDGMVVDALDDILSELIRSDRTPRFIYSLATYQNPTGSVMPRERRLQLIEIAHRHAIPIVEDNCYGDVHFEGEKEPALYALDPESDDHIYLCSLSKILGPGVRMGYLMARPPLLKKVLDRRYDGGNSLLSAAVLAEYFRGNLWEHCARTNAVLKDKRDAVFAGLEASVGDLCTWSEPVGGLFIWVKLLEDIDIAGLSESASHAGVTFAPGRSFHIHGEEIPYLRLAFGYPPMAAIEKGIPILGDCIRKAAEAGGRAAAG
ncbi:MAG: PLP-dependent aminotransferase family protein [Candidatus Latescibacterota bacterium]|nr:PLP-dependent aminotransferase family protein [Candidatus Latescibacterota bacterium]